MCFIDHFSVLDDPRKDINRYDFLDIVFLTVCAVVSGAEGWKDIKQFGNEKIEWLRQYRPVDDTIARLIRAIEPEKMNQAFIDGSMRFARSRDMSRLPLMAIRCEPPRFSGRVFCL